MPLFSKRVDHAHPPAHRKQLPVISPFSGKIRPLDDAHDPIFSQRLFGEGVVIEPSGFRVLAPFVCKIEKFPATKHQIQLRTRHGLRMFIQVGVDAHLQMGAGFRSNLRIGDKVAAGQPLLEFDLPQLKQHLTSTQCYFTLLDSDRVTGVQVHEGNVRANEDIAMTVLI